MTTDIKDITLADKKFQVLKLEPWKRLVFIADLQKDFLMPALKHIGATDVNSLVGGDNSQLDVMALLSGFSQVLDGKSIEKWATRIINDGIIVSVSEDGQRSRMSFSELSKAFTSPVDILNLLKEAVVFNIGDVQELLQTVKGKK